MSDIYSLLSNKFSRRIVAESELFDVLSKMNRVMTTQEATDFLENVGRCFGEVHINQDENRIAIDIS